MTVVQHINDLAAAVMPGVVSDFAALYPSAPALAWEVSTRALAEHGAPPRVVWVPTRDDFQGPQKLPRGGADAQRSLATRVAGVRCVCWGATIAATEDLVECLVRALLRGAGSGRVGVTIDSGVWVSEVGQTGYGEGYALGITFPVDVRAQVTAGEVATVTPTLDIAHSTPGDGYVDAGEP